MIHRTLRIVLIAAAALSTVIAGVRSTFAEPVIHGVTIQTPDRSLLDGTREDDSGTPSESFEEDDEEEDREIHLAFATGTDRQAAAAARISWSSPRHGARSDLGRSTSVRGPPRRM